MCSFINYPMLQYHTLAGVLQWSYRLLLLYLLPVCGFVIHYGKADKTDYDIGCKLGCLFAKEKCVGYVFCTKRQS